MPESWESLRIEVERTIKENKIQSSNFKALSIHDDWQAIEENIYKKFCELDHPTARPIWLWEFFKLKTFAIATDCSHEYLKKLIDEDEKIWFFINGNADKFWFYEGKINAIIIIIEETIGLDEIYIASKKYEWLICINHHDDLIVTGEIMPDRLHALTSSKADGKNI